MSQEQPVAHTSAHDVVQPTIHNIVLTDLADALIKGVADFKAMPTHLVFLCLIYPFVTLVAARTFAGSDLLPLVFPLFAGYTLIGPLVATGMYELSRRREHGLDTSRKHAFDILRHPSTKSVVTLGVLLALIYLVWLLVAQGLYLLFFGDAPAPSLVDFASQVFTTQAGLLMILVGSGVGFFFAAIVLTISVVSFPMLVDRDVGVVQAVQTSLRAVAANPVNIGIWGIVVAVALLLGTLPLFVGLAIVLPVLGHATWHLYRKLVEL